jgi:CubicO group peptidase (beta-lactamase class C family)
VRDAFVANWVHHGEVGAAVHALVGGDVVVDLWGGWARSEPDQPWEPDTLVNAYSTGKPLVALSLLRLVDDGTVGLDDPVAKHWPDFEQAGKGRVTVREALCHRAGVPAIREPLDNDLLGDFDAMAAALARSEPFWRDGVRHAYHTNTYGHLVGGIVRAVRGVLPGDALREVAGTAGADVHFGVPVADLARCADVIFAMPSSPPAFDELVQLEGDEQMTWLGYFNPPGYSSMGVVNTTSWRRAQVPSTNMHASARGLARMYDAILRDGVVSEDLLAEAVSYQSSGWCPTLAQDVTFGLGFQPTTEKRPIGRSPRSYGHFGTGGALGFADPTKELAFGYVMSHVIPRWQSPRNRGLVDALYACVDA